MRCTIWSRDLANIWKKFKDSDLELILDDGTVVGFQCSIQYSPRYGLSLKVNDADPAFALGELEFKKKEILDRLKKRGYLIQINNCMYPYERLSCKISPSFLEKTEFRVPTRLVWNYTLRNLNS